MLPTQIQVFFRVQLMSPIAQIDNRLTFLKGDLTKNYSRVIWSHCSLPSGTAVFTMSGPRRPTAYAHYQKFVRHPLRAP